MAPRWLSPVRQGAIYASSTGSNPFEILSVSHMHLVIILPILLALTVTLASCVNEPDDSHPASLGFQGIVLDENARPIPDVGVHYIFYTNHPHTSFPTRLTFSFGVPTEQHLEVKVFNPLGKPVAVLYDADIAPTGQYWFEYEDTLTTGIYSCRATLEDSVQEIHFDSRTENVSMLLPLDPLTLSSTGGTFFLSYSDLGFGKQVNTFQIGESMLDSISFVLIKSGYQTKVESFRLDTSSTVVRTFRMTSD